MLIPWLMETYICTKLQYRNPKRSCIFTHDHHNHANITENAEHCGDEPEQTATMAICT